MSGWISTRALDTVPVEREGAGGTVPQPMPVVSFPAMLERLYADKHTGPIVIHFAQGCPNVVEFPGVAVRVPLDKPKRRAQT